MSSDNRSRFLFSSCLSFFVLCWSLGASAEEQVQICRYCGSQHGSALFGIDLKGDGLRYAPDRTVDVLHIKLDVTPDFKKRTVAGTTTITFSPIAKPLSQLRLDAADLTIYEVRSKAKVSDYVSSRTDLRIQFEQPIEVGEKVDIEIDHEAEPTRGLYFRTPEMGYPKTDTQVWTQGEAHEARSWFPCFDYPNERSTTEVICRVPVGMTVLSNGRLVSERTDEAAGIKTVHWLQEKPHVNYLICLVAGYMEKLEKQHGDIPLAFYTQPTLIEHAANSFRDTDKIVAFFEDETGIPFPWSKYYQVTIRDFVAGGMENTSLTTLTHRTIFSEATENIRTTRRLDAHEAAHQWFGDLVTCKDWSHLWLNEGFATYYAHLYEGHKFGRDAMLYGLHNDAQGSILTQEKDRKPIVYKAYTNARQQFDYRAYPKGSWVLHMLRSQLGDEIYRRCVRIYLERHAFSSVVTDDLRQVIEQESGRSFDQFFDQWVYHPRFPDLKIAYTWQSSVKLAKVTVEQTQKVDKEVLLFRIPTKLRFVVDGRSIDQDIEIHEKKHEFFVPLSKKPEIVRFDPDLTVLAKITFDKSDELLFAQLSNQDDMIGRLLAVEAISKRKTHKSVERLKALLSSDPFFGVRIAASSALQKIHNDESFAALTVSLAQSDARVRQQVVEDIGKFFREETLGHLQVVLNTEKNPAIVAGAIRSAGRFSGSQSRALISRFLASDSFRNELADAAVAAIRMQNDASYQETLLAVLQKRQAVFTSRGFGQALETLARISRELEDKSGARDFITKQVNHPKEAIRIAAIRALGVLGDPRSTAVLDSLADKDRSDRVAEAARKAIAEVQKKAPIVPQEIADLRGEVTKLRSDNEKLKKDLENLKKQFEAAK